MNRAKRIDHLYTFFKKESNDKLISIIINKSNADFEKYIVPLVNQYCPEIKKTPFYLKLRLGSASVYSLGSYLMIFISGRKYNKYRYLSKLFNLNEKYFLKFLNLINLRSKMRAEIMYASAFIVIIDHIFDHELDNYTPSERSSVVKKALTNFSNESNLLSLLSYLSKNLSSKEIKFIEDWCDAEARSFTINKSLREYGVKAAIDLLYGTIKSQVPKKYIQFMYEIGFFVQMIDDYIDLEDDIKQNQITPVVEKIWTYDTIINQYKKCANLICEISKENNISEKMISVVESNLMAIGYNLVLRMANKDAN